MFTTYFFLLLLGFQLWYWASPQVKMPPAGYQEFILKNPQYSRMAGSALVVLASLLFVLKLGLMTGLCAWLVGLMGVGSLVVALAPFRYLRLPTVLALYVGFLIMEVAL
ncbi:hypothetical protein J7E24_16685 [Hymenobacter sp. ISL-91]|uniref:hypothetical protein n=1 Tax=Hymenobacter sp. ISL-91 TaxID=2819151 RepID=UPI001BE5DF2C|nr:hypothetical protein [Hymenobacter sp. ISL-91]MBT2559426.1 hypothetical protein [Hymenobacter sp. ISL-91]